MLYVKRFYFLLKGFIFIYKLILFLYFITIYTSILSSESENMIFNHMVFYFYNKNLIILLIL